VEVWGWLAAVAGAALAIIALRDVYLTVLHPDREGAVAVAVQRATWRVAVSLGERHPRAHRRFVAGAGPVMTVLTLAAWMALFVFGVTLLVWPNLDAYRADDEHGALTFIDALYYVGVTVSVLGYGDISPVQPTMQALAFVASLLGFVLLTAVVTYLVELVTSVELRNRLAARVDDALGGNPCGSHIVLQRMAADPRSLERDLAELAQQVRSVEDHIRRYALTSLYYRSAASRLDPEVVVRHLCEVVVAARMAAGDPRYALAGPAVADLGRASRRLVAVMATRHLGVRRAQLVLERQPAGADAEDRAGIASRVRQQVQGPATSTRRDDLELLTASSRLVACLRAQPADGGGEPSG
jgi:hypothetical protein